ncbi:MAG: hypothetical protein EA401_03380 [Planctomycetota bacterium]|nr:MAG: hypothetical protein EA401_03380 [Planctomycetota bacterium]
MFSANGWDDYKHRAETDKKILKRINKFQDRWQRK